MIELLGIGARAGSFELRDISFEIPRGRYGVVIGPAGSGKTTLLETIAGVTEQRSGVLSLDGRVASDVPMESRGIGLVYQHGFLFPHLDVRGNISYGAADAQVTTQLITLFELDALASRSVESLSGGERQVVAIARALARRPSILLLDEPFSALDPRRRALVRRQVRETHRAWGTTVLQVTHDFAEAGLLGDVMVLLDRGRVLQHGPPAEVFSRPASAYVAEFLGAENVYAGVARTVDSSVTGQQAIEVMCGPLVIHAIGEAQTGPTTVVVRAEEVVLSRVDAESSMRNHFAGTVTEISGFGAQARVAVDVSGIVFVAALTWTSVQELGLRSGERVFVSFKAFAVHLC
jgi:molybdopterin-binding protein